MIKCFIFDLDGTLFKTFEANFKAYYAAFEEIGVRIKKKDYLRLYGLRADSMLNSLYPKITKTQIKIIRTKKSLYYQKNVGYIIPNKRLFEMISYFKNTIKVALVTTASKVNADFILDYFEVKNLFDVIVYGEDVGKGKPDPECYLTCIKKCKRLPEECLIFEDSDYGIKAAEAAGINVIKVLF